MTSSVMERRNTGRGSRRGTFRALVWGLHVGVTVLAVFSLLMNGFRWWVDLRMLGEGGTALVKIFWAGTVLVVPWCAGPRLAGFGKPVWVLGGWSAEWSRRLLWPTYFVMACLVANTVYYYRLVMLDRIDTGYPVPMPLVVLLLLAAWTLVTREWVRGPGGSQAPASRRTQFGAILHGLTLVAMGGAFFGLYGYSRPLSGKADVAVVLGNRVMPDGTASVTLRERTLAAVRLYQRGQVRHLFLSGAVWPNPGGPEFNEPKAMKQVCVQHGVREEDITLDPVGDNTRATGYNVMRFREGGAIDWKTAVVCTDQYHLLRSVRSLRQFGVDARTAPATPDEWQCADLFSTLREMTALVVYTVRPNYHKPRNLGMKLNDARVLVRKAAGVLEIYDGATLMKKYACITGGNMGDKSVEGDRRTPIGTFRVVFKNPDSKFHLSLGLDYPTAEDAKRGLDSGLITRAQYDGILDALKSDLALEENQKKLWYTALGGEIFIHGHAEGRTGTAGCVAVSNPDIEEIYATLPVGTPVEIRP